MKRTFTILSTALFLLTGTCIFAQPQAGQGKSGNREFRIYYEKNIKPVLTEQQEKFMNVLSDEEKAELQRIKKDRNTVRDNMSGTVSAADRENTQKAHFAAFKSRLETIEDAHPAEKEQYIKEMTLKKEQWQKDMKAIHGNNNMSQNNKKNYLDRVDDPAFILMWDPNRNMPSMGMRNNKMQQKETAQPGIHIFPDPASATVTVKITGVKNKAVSATVYDAKSKEVKELFDAASTLPILSFSFDVSGWENGIYTVKTKFDNRNMTMDFKVEK